MEKIIKVIKSGALLVLVGAPIYLANEGELGVNLTTILSTATPTAVFITAQVYEVIKYVLPVTTVKKIIGSLTNTIGQENVDYLKKQVDEKGVEYFAQLLGEFMTKIDKVLTVVEKIEEKQSEVI